MGQYWFIFNLTARKFLKPRDLGCGLKLGEFGSGGFAITAFVLLLAEQWQGHRIVISGDYDENDGDDFVEVRV